MANKRVRDMAAASPLTGTEKFYADDGSSDVYVTSNQIATFVGASGGGIVSVGDYSPTADGVTDDKTAFQAASNALLAASAPLPKQTVTMTIASPCVVTYTPATYGYVRVDDGVKFSTTGALPTGITAGTMYFVQPPVTDTTFQLGTTRNWNANRSNGTWMTGHEDHPALNTSGSQSGVHSMKIYGHKPVTLKIPPGIYAISANSTINNGGVKKLIIDAYGASVNELYVGGGANANGWSWNWGTSTTTVPDRRWWMFGFIEDADPGDTTITLVANHIPSAVLFDVGMWLMINGVDVQASYNDPASWPPNTMQTEFVQVTSVNTGTGAIDVSPPLKYGYRSHWPKAVQGEDVAADVTAYMTYSDTEGGGFASSYFRTSSPGSGFAFPQGGPGLITGINYNWDCEVEIRGLHDFATRAQPYFLNPLRRLKMLDCVFEDVGYTPGSCKEMIYENCVWNSTTSLEVDKCVDYAHFRNCTMLSGQIASKTYTPTLWVFEGCRVGSFYGSGKRLIIRDSAIDAVQISSPANTSVVVENSCIKNIYTSTELYEQGGSFLSRRFIGNDDHTFSNGVFTYPKVQSMATVYTTGIIGHTFYFDSALGVGGSIPAIDSFGAPFQILDVKEDASNVYLVTNLKEIPPSTTVAPYATVTTDIASPGTVNWTAHGLVASNRICFMTTGALPTGLAEFTSTGTGTSYFVKTVNTADQFTVSATNGGTAIDFTGTQSGVHTAYAKHFLHIAMVQGISVTVRDCHGSPEIENLNGCEDRPMYTYFHRTYSGNIGSSLTLLGYSNHLAFVRGYLEEFRVNVIKPYTGATATLTLGCTSNGYSYSSGFVSSAFSQTINLKIAGERIITPGDATGAQAGDTIAAYADWIAREIRMAASANIADADQGTVPIVEITIKTNLWTTKGSFGYTTADSNTTSGGRIMDWLSREGSPTSEQG